MARKQVLIVTDDAGESYEILYAKHRFEEAGFTPQIAASKKKRIHGVIHDFHPDWNTYIEKPGYFIEPDLAIGKVRADDYEAILLAGGRAPEFLRHHKPLIELVREFDRQEKWILAICHGIQILLTAGLGAAKKLTCYENVRFEVETCGGHWSKKQCQVDGRIITAQTWQSHPEFYREIFKHLRP
jgi:protease I